MAGWWREGAGGRTYCVIGLQRMFGIPWLGPEWEVGRRLEGLAVIDHVLAVLSQWLQGCGSEGCCHTWSGQPLDTLITLNALLLLLTPKQSA